MEFSQEVLDFCKKHNIDPDLLDEEIIEAIDDEEGVGICGSCNCPQLEDDLTECSNCKKSLCKKCFGNPNEDVECLACTSEENYK